MKEFLRFLMCIIIIAVLLFVYTFLKNQSAIYDENIDNNSGDVIEKISGDNEENDFSGEYKNIESGDQTLSGDAKVNFSGDEDKEEDISQNQKKPEAVSGEVLVKNTDKSDDKVNDNNMDNLTDASGD